MLDYVTASNSSCDNCYGDESVCVSQDSHLLTAGKNSPACVVCWFYTHMHTNTTQGGLPLPVTRYTTLPWDYQQTDTWLITMMSQPNYTEVVLL